MRAAMNSLFVREEVPRPLPTPPPIFDLILALFFAWAGWRVWKLGKGWRSGAAVLWLLALGGFYTYSRSF
jgi:hypothetical protein